MLPLGRGTVTDPVMLFIRTLFEALSKVQRSPVESRKLTVPIRDN